MRRLAAAAALAVLLSFPAATLNAQSLDAVGTRAQGMGGAFVGVADDATAVYWNPAGLAGGAYFSLVLDGVVSEAVPRGSQEGSSRSGWLLALSTPALGLSYYRLQNDTVRPSGVAGRSRVESLVTQHVGGTLVQSLADIVAVGATVKLIRGVAAATDMATVDREAALHDVDLMGRGSNKVDLDVGVMASGSAGRAGVTVRNVSEPSFRTADGQELRLRRQVRGGASILLLQSWKVAADLDFTTNHGVFGDVRELAIGSEGQLTRRLAGRGGIRLNTAGEGRRSPAISAGGSFAAFGSLLIDAQVTGGSDKAFRGWGLAGRLVF
jgi:hypothetical protein